MQYPGLFWSQLNGRDWTVNAFLASSRGGLALDVAADQATQRALPRALDLLLDTPLEDLRGRRLEATDFDALLSTDPVRDLLTWMNDPEGSVAAWRGARWDAFRSRCQADWKLDPKADGVLVAAERISAGRQALWWAAPGGHGGRLPGRVLAGGRRGAGGACPGADPGRHPGSPRL